MNSIRLRRGRIATIVFAALFIILSACTFFHFSRTNSFNRKLHEFNAPDTADLISFTIKPRGGVSDSWDKYDVPVNGQIVTLKGCTYEATISNSSNYQIEDWDLRLNINEDCFINNSWCGTVEIHQHHDGTETVQTLDLRNIVREEVILKYIPVGQDILIELHKGDYVLYNLNAQVLEAPISAFNGSPGSTSIGFIFYYLKNQSLDLSDFKGTFNFYKSYMQGPEPKILAVLFILLFLILIVRVSVLYAYKKAQKETEIRMTEQRMHELEQLNEEIQETNRQLERSNDVIRAVSEIYYILYSIDIEQDIFFKVRADQSAEKFLKQFSSARQALKSIPDIMYSEPDMSKVYDFYNMDTWQEKLKDKDTLSFDFLSKFKGWVRASLIVSKRDRNNNAIHVLCAVQDVDKLIKEEQERKKRLEEANIIMKSYNEALNRDVEKKTAHIIEIQTKVVRGLANVIGNRDMDTVGHVNRTSEVIQIIVDEFRNQVRNVISDQQAADIVRAAPMHDLGKIYIDTVILCKPGRFTQEEYEKMKMHSQFSGDIVNFVLNDVEEPHFVKVAFNVARFHHERWDGTGYPDKLAGEQIPLEARLMAIADVYDALVSKRCYKEPMSFEQAFNLMNEEMGKQFDPSLQNVFLAVRDKLEAYYKKSNDSFEPVTE